MALDVAKFCDALRDGGFLADDCDTRIRKTFRRVEALARIMESGVGDGLFEAFKAPCFGACMIFLQ